MKNKMLFLIVLVAAFTACKNTPTLDKATTVATQLQPEQLHNFDSVLAYLKQAKASQRDSSSKAFLQAIDLIKNKKEALKSVGLFQQALMMYPNNKGYYELGNAYLEINKDSLAFMAFDMAEKLNYNPLGYVLFKKACAVAGMASAEDYDKQSIAFEFLKNAIENGFVDREKIYNEPKFIYLKKDGKFTTTYNEAMSGNGDPATILWDGYSKNFKQCSFPLTINLEAIKAITQPEPITYDYEKYVTEMRDYKFSRDVGNEFFYYTKVATTPAFETVIYGSHGFEYGDKLPYLPTQFYIASYNKKGMLIDKMPLAGQKSFTDLMGVATLQQNLYFEIKEYKNTWAKPTEKDGFDNNTIAKSNLLQTTKYKIGADGKFVSDAKLLGFIPNELFDAL